MSIDSEFLRSIKHRRRFKERIARTPLYLFEEKTRDIIKLMSRYFKTFKTCELIDKGEFVSWVNELKSEVMTEADRTIFDALMEDFDDDLSLSHENFLTDRLHESDVVYQASDMLQQWAGGGEIEIIDQLKAVLDKAAFNRDDRDGIKLVTESISEILEHAGSDWGFDWELPILSKAMRPAQPGDMILVAARPDQGKTTFLGEIIRPWQKQVEMLYPGQGRCILWLNNEGPGTRIKLRMLQSALKLTIGELSERANAGEDLEALYEEVIGCKNNLHILDVHSKNTAQIERKIEEYNPAIIVWDMLDKVRYVSEDLGRVSRTDEYLEGLYSWVRDTGVIRDCVNIVSTQLSGDAENMQYPLLGMLKDSKTGKQGTADVIITFGSVSTTPRTRYIGLTKNKLNLGKTTARLGEVVFDGARGVISMPEEVE